MSLDPERKRRIGEAVAAAAERRLDGRVTIPTDPSACWEWTGPRSDQRSNTRAIRRLFRRHHGREVLDGHEVHHSCLNGPWCMNPLHLVEMTNAEHKAEHARLRREAKC